MIPERTRLAIDRYVQEHYPVGRFLMAVLTNDLEGIVRQADAANRAGLFDIIQYCWAKLPGKCWGTPDKVEAWLAQRYVVDREADTRRVQS